jgi:hypothetical protein
VTIPLAYIERAAFTGVFRTFFFGTYGYIGFGIWWRLGWDLGLVETEYSQVS